MHRFAALLLILSTPAVIAGRAGPVALDPPEAARLRQLFHDSDEAMLRRHPLQALMRGDLRYADRLGDFFVDANAEGDRRAAEGDLAALARIDPARLGRTDRLAYDVFRDRQQRELRDLAPAIVAIDRVLPIDHLNGVQTWYPDFASGKGAAPFKTVLDYDNNLARNTQYAAALDRAIGRFRQGMAGGVVQPRLVVANMIEEFDALLADPAERSPFYQPVTTFPAAVPSADRARLTAAYAAQVRDVIQPAHRRMRDFLATTYLPAADDDRARRDPRWRGLLPRRAGTGDDAAGDRRGVASARPRRAASRPGRARGAEGEGRVRRHPAAILRIPAHRSALPSDQRRRRPRPLRRDRRPR